MAGAIRQAQAETLRPSLIVCRTHIGYGSPNKVDTSKVHGSPLGADELAATRVLRLQPGVGAATTSRIIDRLGSDKSCVSFEFFPPKTPAANLTLGRTVATIDRAESWLETHSGRLRIWLALGFTGWVGPIANWVHLGGLLCGAAWGVVSSSVAARR